jgi:hypothetical protein
MSEVIKSGDSGKTLRIDSKNRALAFSIVESESVSASLDGNTFFITTTNLTLTTANMSFVLYIQNTDTVDWVVTELTQSYSVSTGGAGGFILNQFHVGPTGGTLLTAGTPAIPVNLNTGKSTISLDATAIYGAEGSTVTGGFGVNPGMIHSDSVRVPFSGGPIVIARGTSLAFGVQPPAGNTSMQAKVDFIIHRKVMS